MTAIPPITDQPLTVVDDTADEALTKKFLSLSGYKATDLMGSSQARRTFSTSNGGKYAVSPKGTRLRTLSGPPTPKDLATPSGGDDEE